MKKTAFIAVLLLSALSLTSCKVNWFGGTVDLPWFCVVIPIAVIFISSYLYLITRTYVCPECKTKFKPKWYQLSVCIHFMGKRIVKCPNCGRKGFCEQDHK